VKREWFTLLTKAMVNPNFALFSPTRNGSFFSQESHVNPRHLQYFEFVGKLFAFALTHKFLLIASAYSPLLYKMMLRHPITPEDVLAEFEEEAAHVRSVEMMIQAIQCKEDFEAAGIELPFVYAHHRLLSLRSYSLFPRDKGSSRDPSFMKGIEFVRATEAALREVSSEEDDDMLPERVGTLHVRDVIQLKPGGADIMITFETMH
jgi:hypothetical protein